MPVHELMNFSNQQLCQMFDSLDSHNFDNPIYDVIKALEQVKTGIQGELASHLQQVNHYEEDTLAKVKKAFSEIKEQYQDVHD